MNALVLVLALVGQVNQPSSLEQRNREYQARLRQAYQAEYAEMQRQSATWAGPMSTYGDPYFTPRFDFTLPSGWYGWPGPSGGYGGWYGGGYYGGVGRVWVLPPIYPRRVYHVHR